ncbi:MAG: hypothetical protein GQ574_09755 [Crocinitomix sp.]|nr:hypothetical protein [Crocinitomix sp.]
MKNITSILSLFLFMALAFSCNKKNDNINTIKKLHKTYKNGEISECTYEDETVYSCGINAYDAGGVIYDKDGEIIGSCNYAWGTPDTICGELEDCTVIYRVADNIWGQAHVDKYDLGD